MNSLIYVDAPNQNLVCCICRMPFVDPCTNQTCSHTFCRQCIIQSLAHSPQCPIDRSILRIEDIHSADPIIRSLVDELVIKCSNEPAGCSYTCQRQLLESHVKNDCLYALVPCPAGGCAEETHRSTCLKRFYRCEDCKTEQACSSRAAHASCCHAAQVRCPQEHHGCPWEGRRKDVSSHTTTCSYEAIKGFFAIQDAQKATLVNENTLLKQKVETLESQLRVAQYELRCVQSALEPWSRIPTSRSMSVLSPSSQLQTSLQHNNISPSLSYMPPGDQASITQYFPDISFDDLQARSIFSAEDQRVPERPNFRPSTYQNWQSTGSLPIGSGSRPSQNVVAPLNLNTTLEGSLEGLRESIVTLSTCLDSLGRRSDIALTNETLRLNEEVTSLRVALHGLRMQARTFVHTIMMDRNAQVTGQGPGFDPLFIQGDIQWLPNRSHMQNLPHNSITKL
ncbi:hypothetical protein EV368DRAFT_37601 [Lentinula lateritia]|uniref:Uncharacterized protein n=1 Tax=Lentinula aff. lateritia TaxID=2804960 RepID=A0ACC1U486_9AGAR|nr:hypothetical protein F5876DRAFT_38646 [Lentinula aff. lateritia]KAJ3854048.1 hypothetical protein EV368DRAFT_37601 [Lentinula lateritia]